MSRIALLALILAAVLFAGCRSNPAAPTAAYHVDGQGQVSAAARSALNGSTAPGRQEIVGVYVPFIGTGLALKAGLEWDGMPGVVEVPVGPFQQQGAVPTVAQQQAVMVPQRVVIPQTVVVPHAATCKPQTATQYVPAQRLVPLPVPQEQSAAPCP